MQNAKLKSGRPVPCSDFCLFNFYFEFLCKSIQRSASCAMIAAGCKLNVSPGTLDTRMKRKQTMLSPFPRKWLGAAFALALLVASFTNTFAQQKQEPEKAEPLTIGSTNSTVLSNGTRALDEGSRLLADDPYWQFFHTAIPTER